MRTYLLFVDDPQTGVLRVETFATRFDRALAMIALASQSVRLRTRDYPRHA